MGAPAGLWNGASHSDVGAPAGVSGGASHSDVGAPAGVSGSWSPSVSVTEVPTSPIPHCYLCTAVFLFCFHQHCTT